jgi:hypothetical protein
MSEGNFRLDEWLSSSEHSENPAGCWSFLEPCPCPDSSVDSADWSIEGFQQEHYVILNQAIGGKAGGDASGVVYPTRYEVDYVRLYEWVPAE